MAGEPIVSFFFEHALGLGLAFLLGACIGSFLNVVIYRWPLGMSVNEPKRSFCPICKNQLSIWQNLPIVSWIFLRGKCAHCGSPISFRYVAVEITTAILFALTYALFPLDVFFFLSVLIALLIVITWIHAEHLIIPTSLTWAGSLIGFLASIVAFEVSALSDEVYGWREGLLNSGIGWAVGFLGLRLVVELGKKAFGKKAMKFEQEVDWSLLEAEEEEEPLFFVIDGEKIAWWDLFFRKSDRLIIHATEVVVNDELVGAGELVIETSGIKLADGRYFELEKLKSLSGRAQEFLIPREAMGMGDVHLLGMIGAFLGWKGVVFTLMAASFSGLFAALIGRIGLGKQLPFGPFLAIGAALWIFGGWRLWQWYASFLGFSY